jgi:ornithine cyclodeaminase
VLVLSRSDVERLLPMPACIALMRETLAARAGGRTIQPSRTAIRTPDGAGAMLTMPAWIASPGALGVKVVSVFPGNCEIGLDSHQGAVLSLDPATGQVLAILEAGAVTAIRTAAVSAVATDLLANPAAADLALLGAGAEARTHLAAVAAVRKLRRVRVWSRSAERAHTFAETAVAPSGVKLEIMASARDAVEDAAIICTLTASPTPVLEGQWIARGAHVNAVGAHTPETRELDTDAVTAARIFVDARESALQEAGDLLIPIKERRLRTADIHAELGEVITGARSGRASSTEITLFKSLGLGIEDVAAARHVVTEALTLGVGQEIAF